MKHELADDVTRACLHNEALLAKYQLYRFPSPAGLMQELRDVFIMERKATVEDERIKRIAKYVLMICQGS